MNSGLHHWKNEQFEKIVYNFHFWAFLCSLVLYIEHVPRLWIGSKQEPYQI